MPFENCSQAAPARRGRRAVLFRAVCLLILLAALVGSPAAAHAQEQPHPQPQAEAAHAAQGQHEAAEEAHAEGILPTIARLFNFAVLVGVLVYFLKTPVANYLVSRHSQIRQDLVTAAEMRATATAQLAEIDRRLKSLPAELEALRVRGAEDVKSERARIEQAAAAERERLLDHTRREIEMRLRVARRELVEHAAQLAVEVAQARIARTITPEDQLRLVDRYARQLQEAR
jgi:F-type H+-transporting ATPase subunit b